jgi:glycosyltransferase involved in cell wall biosynthesis
LTAPRPGREAPDGRLTVIGLVESLRPQGGAERLARQLVMRLDPERFERILCVSRVPFPGETPETVERALGELRGAGVEVIRLERRSRVDVAAWRRLWPALRRAHVIHAHMMGSNAWAVILGRLARVPVVVAHEHTWSFDGRPFRKLIDRELIARGSDAFVAVSREDQRRMAEVEGIAPERTRFVPLGIPTPREGDPGKVRDELGIGPGVPVVGFVGRLHPQKALGVLLEAGARLAPRVPGLKVLIAGGGDSAGMSAQVERLGIGDTVVLLGHRADVPDVLAALDVAVSSSDYEGSPLAVMEYMEAEKPVVATAVGGVPDIIEHGVEGLLVPRRDPAALADALAELLSDPERAKEMGRRGRERRRREFDLDVMVERFASLYEELYGAKRNGRPRGASPRR